ncbi:hypothetical protein [Actinoallomurus sp. NPDC052274]|uniref:hypothetical protein n=1 Tax=Actinoallomurus sp. NPDC052274 TaxID=3155420 RepID=UPI00344AC7B7
MTDTQGALAERAFRIFQDGGLRGNPDSIERTVLAKASRFFGTAAKVQLLEWCGEGGPEGYYADLVSVSVDVPRRQVEPIGTKVVPIHGIKGNTQEEIAAKMVVEARPAFDADANLYAEIDWVVTCVDPELDGFSYKCRKGKVFQVG